MERAKIMQRRWENKLGPEDYIERKWKLRTLIKEAEEKAQEKKMEENKKQKNAEKPGYCNARELKLSEEEIELIRAYEQRTGKPVLMTREEKKQAYIALGPEQRQMHIRGLENTISMRLNLDNSDSFDGPDDSWKMKVFHDNLEILYEIAREEK